MLRSESVFDELLPTGPGHTKNARAIVLHYGDSKSLRRQEITTAKSLKKLLLLGNVAANQHR